MIQKRNCNMKLHIFVLESFIFTLLFFFINSITVDAASLSTDNGSTWKTGLSFSSALTQAQSDGTASKPAIIKLQQNITKVAVQIDGYVIIDLNGYQITNNATSSSTGVQRCLRIAGKCVTIRDSSEWKTGKIIGGNTPDQGGMAAYIASGKLILESGTMTANGSANGGGIISIGAGTFEMKGGKITGGSAGIKGGGIDFYSSSGTFIMTGGVVENNKATGATSYGDGVSVGGGNITIGGTAVIKDNIGGENLYLKSGKKIIVSTSTPLSDGAYISVTTEAKPTKNNPVAITSIGSVDNSQYFYSDNASYKVYNKGTGSSQYLVLSVHEHKWKYLAEGNSIKAYCEEEFGNANCDYYGEDKGITLSLEAVSPTFSSEDEIPCWKHTDAVTIAVTGSESWEANIGIDSIPTIYYRDLEDPDYSISTVAPTSAGLYEATITKGDATALLRFRIREVYNVSFNANGGYGEMTTMSVPAGDFSIPECTFKAPLNQEFVGWSLSENGEINSTGSTSLTRNITLYARWEKHHHDYMTKTIREGVYKIHCGCGNYIIRYN